MADITEIKRIMIESMKRAEEAGLMVGLYGSISHRIDDDTIYFAGGELRSTPFTTDDIRRVKIKKVQGDAAVHAAVYRTRSDINAVMCTKQCFGSALGVVMLDALVAEDAEGNMIKIRTVPFTIPGSDAQRSHVQRLAGKDSGQGFLITSNHGVVAYGQDAEGAITSAANLEDYARLYLSELGNMRVPFGVIHGFDSFRDASGINYVQKDTPARVRLIHEEIYRRRPDVGAVVHNVSEAAATVSRLYEKLFPLYDDFVRLIGTAVPIPGNQDCAASGNGVEIKKGINAAFCTDDGAYCFGKDMNEAAAAALALEKNCIAQISGTRLGGSRVISGHDIRRLRISFARRGL